MLRLFINNVAYAFSTTRHLDRAAQGLAPTILILAGFAVIAILVVGWIGNSIAYQAATEASCIDDTSNGSPSDKCLGLDSDGANVINNQINSQKGQRF